MLRRFLLSAALVSITSVAQAEFTHVDWLTANDQQVTLDSNTGLEWLKLNNTRNKSIDVVKSELDSEYAGWRLPSKFEVNTLFSTLFDIDAVNNGTYAISNSSSEAHHNTLINMLEWLGKVNVGTITSTYGLYYKGDELNRVVMSGGAGDTSESGRTTHLYDDYEGYDERSYGQHYGVFLVRNDSQAQAASDVSGPLSIAALGLAGLAGLRRRR